MWFQTIIKRKVNKFSFFISKRRKSDLKYVISKLSQIVPEDFHPGTKSALVLAAFGSSEMDIVSISYILRRAGLVTTIAGLQGYDPIRLNRRLVVKPDTSLDFALDQDYDVVIIPCGHEGVRSFGVSDRVGKLLKKQESTRGIVAAIGTGVLVLCVHGIYANSHITGNPATANYISHYFKYENKPMVTDFNLISGRSSIQSIDVAFSIVERTAGKHTAITLASRLFYKFKPTTFTDSELKEWYHTSRNFDEV